MVGMAEVGHQLDRIGWQSIRIIHGASACVIFILLQEIQKMANKDITFGYHPWAPSHAYANRRWVNPAGTQHNPMLWRRVMLIMTLKADGLQKGWGFRVGTRNVDSLTGRAGEVVEAFSVRKVDVACIQETQ